MGPVARESLLWGPSPTTKTDPAGTLPQGRMSPKQYWSVLWPGSATTRLIHSSRAPSGARPGPWITTMSPSPGRRSRSAVIARTRSLSARVGSMLVPRTRTTASDLLASAAEPSNPRSSTPVESGPITDTITVRIGHLRGTPNRLSRSDAPRVADVIQAGCRRHGHSGGAARQLISAPLAAASAPATSSARTWVASAVRRRRDAS